MQKIIFVTLLASALAFPQGYKPPSIKSNGVSQGSFGGQQDYPGSNVVSGGFERTAGSNGEGQIGHVSSSGSFGGSANVDQFAGNTGAVGGFDISTAEGFGGSSNTFGAQGGSPVGVGGRDASSCAEGQVLDIKGNCVVPEIVRNIYHYTAPQMQFRSVEEIPIPTPKLQYNVVFVRTPETPEGQEPVVIPPPQEKTIVYVLHKDGDIEGPERIEIPSALHKPEVFYVKYNEGDNPTLPIGIDLQSALARAVNQQGQTVAVVDGGSVGGSFETGAVGGSFETGAVGSGISGGSFNGGAVGGAISGARFEGAPVAVDSGSAQTFEGGAFQGGAFEGGAFQGNFVSGGQVSGSGVPQPSSIYQQPQSQRRSK